MSYNIRNKKIALVCLSFAIMMTVSNSLHAEETVPPMDLGEVVAIDENNQPQNESIDVSSNENTDNTKEETSQTSEDVNSQNIDEMFADLTEDTSSQSQQDIAETDNKSTEEKSITEEVSTSEAESMVIDAPKSPFENFGNTILARVDNDLFNQMSNIEKQTTLLNLELKREEVRNKVEALKAQRAKALMEEINQKMQAEQKAKELELEREMKLLEAKEKIKAKEIELEKVRQAKLLNDYMNEMLAVNQKWVEKNAELQNKVSELRKERIDLIKEFESKIKNVKEESSNAVTLANTAKDAFNRTVTSYKSQIRNLKKSLADSENAVEQLKAGNSANPFADLTAAGIDENATDMSNEYAIMDITGTGNEIIAKIVNKEGTTFIVHKGSMLKGGEVVTTITDNFVAFDKNGAKSYLYTGGTVREYEPSASFNDNDKLDKEASSTNNSSNNLRNVSNVRGIQGNSSTSVTPKKNNITSQYANKSATNSRNSNSRKASASRSSSKSSKRRSGGGVASSASGMFVK